MKRFFIAVLLCCSILNANDAKLTPVEQRSVYFLTGFNINEHCFYGTHEKEYEATIQKNLDILKLGIKEPEVKEIMKLLKEPQPDFVANFKVCRRARNDIEIILAKKANEDWADYLLGVLLSEIATYKTAERPVKQYLPLLELVSKKYHELKNNKHVEYITEMVYLERLDALTIEQFARIARKIIDLYGDGFGKATN